MRALPLLVLGALAATATPAAFATERSESVMLRASGSVPFTKEAIHVRIDHGYAVTDHRQLVTAAAAGQTEGVYQLVVAPRAVATKFSYWNGREEVKGEIFERADAQGMYQTVTAARRDPGLFEEIAPGRFRYRIFPFAPNEAKRVEVRWETWLSRQAKSLRYVVPLAHPRSAVIVDIDGAAPKSIRSTTHDIEVQPLEHDTVRVRANGRRADAPALVAGDAFELLYDPAAPTASLVHSEPARDAYAVLELPPFEAKAPHGTDVTFVVDRSGALTDSLPIIRRAVDETLGHLTVRDRVNVIGFDESVTPLYAAPREVSPDTLRDAHAFVGRLRDGVGSDVGGALRAALAGQMTSKGRERVVVVVADSEARRELLRDLAETRPDVRMVFLALGGDVTAFAPAAQSHEGIAMHVDPNELASTMARVYHRATSAHATQVKLELSGASGIDLATPMPASLVIGEPTRIAVRCRPKGVLHAKLTADVGGQPVTLTADADVGTPKNRPWVAHAWAKQRLDGAIQSGDRETAVEVALTHELVSKHTAFFAIPESEAARVRGQLERARDKKQSIAWANGDDVAPTQTGTGGASAPPMESAPPQARVSMRESGMAAPAVEPRHGRGCAGCATARVDAAADRWLALLSALAIGVVIVRRRANHDEGDA